MNSESHGNKRQRSTPRILAEDSTSEDLVVCALQECQLAIDRGEPIDREAILEKYSKIRNELAACLDGLELMQAAGRLDSVASAEKPPQLTPLGDFRIIREIGRGGMGVVYEAEQLSVGRNVALKVLPYAAMLDRRQIARFQNEARAAATLEHPHIVPVYFVGNERGVYYYAMRLVHGKNLAEILNEIRTTDGNVTEANLDSASSTLHARNPDVSTEILTDRTNRRSNYYASVARIGMQVAEAMEFAHGHGIVHRDIKPANVMLDEVGDAWVTDFGLARIESAAGVTMTGDLVGTLRYMSPEQTRSCQRMVDHRTDIYSLGATLYELLTTQPAFLATDRTALLRRIAIHDPKAPSKIDAGIPRDLETIVLKSLQKDPKDRYSTAQFLADDLRRFLTHNPIRARRTPVAQRVRMWTRRHPSLVAATTIACAVTLLATAIMGFLLANHEHATRLQQEATAKKLESAFEEKTSALIHAEATAEELRQLVYVGEMRQAFEAWNHGWTREVEMLLAKQIPSNGQTDHRGFEWRILHQMAWKPAPVELLGHDGPVHDLAVFRDGTRLASVGDDFKIRVWDLTTFTEDFVLSDTRKPFQLAGALEDVLGKWNRGNSLVASKNHKNLRALAVSPDGNKLATGNLVLTLWDLEQRAIKRDLAVFPTRIFGVAFSPDSQQVAAHSADEGVKVVNVDGTVVKSELTGMGSYRLSYSSDGTRLFAPYRDRKTDTPTKGVRSWDTTDWDETVDYPLNSTPRACVATEDGMFLFCGTYHGRVNLINLFSHEARTVLSAQRSRLTDIAIAENDLTMAVTYSDGSVGYVKLDEDLSRLGDGVNLQPKFLSVHNGSANAVRFIDSQRIATAGDDGVIRISSVNGPATKRTLSKSLSGQCRFRKGTNELIVSTRSGVRRYDTQTWRVIDDCMLWNSTRSNERSYRASALAIDDSGNTAGIGSMSGDLVTYDMVTNRELSRTAQRDIRASSIPDMQRS